MKAGLITEANVSRNAGIQIRQACPLTNYSSIGMLSQGFVLHRLAPSRWSSLTRSSLTSSQSRTNCPTYLLHQKGFFLR
jgi:hypothetical protein